MARVLRPGLEVLLVNKNPQQEPLTLQRRDERRIACPTALGASDVATSIRAEGQPPLFIEGRAVALQDRTRFLAWLAKHLRMLDVLTVQHCGIVLRGFPLANAQDFDAVTG